MGIARCNTSRGHVKLSLRSRVLSLRSRVLHVTGETLMSKYCHTSGVAGIFLSNVRLFLALVPIFKVFKFKLQQKYRDKYYESTNNKNKTIGLSQFEISNNMFVCCCCCFKLVIFFFVYGK